MVVILHVVVGDHTVRSLLLILSILRYRSHHPWSIRLLQHISLGCACILFNCQACRRRYILRRCEQCSGNSLSLSRSCKESLSRGIAVPVSGEHTFRCNYTVLCWTLSSISCQCEDFLIIFELCDDFIGFPLCPDEVILVPLLKITHWPPKSLFQAVSYEYWIVSLTNIILVWGKWLLWEWNYCVVRSVDLHKEFPVILFF